MLIKTLREHFHNSLKEEYPDTEIQSFFYLLAECYLKLKRVDIALNLYMPVSNKKVQKFEMALTELKRHKPIQYIIGTTEFYGLSFKVTESTLIPRPETEELVAWILETLSQDPETFTILDIGTGTGCIAIALAKHLPNAKVYAVDISKKALSVAKTNAKLNKVEVEFVELDILNWQNDIQHSPIKDVEFDVIVSNPPYVRHLEKAQMSANVLKHEPAEALYVEDDQPLLFYKAITEYASSALKNQGHLFFEINQYLGAEMQQLLYAYGFGSISLKKDIFEKNRMISGHKN